MNELIQPGDFACVKIISTPGRLITVGEWLDGSGSAASAYDHAFIYVGMGDEKSPRGYVIGAQPSGARLDPMAAYDHRGDALWSSGKIPLTQEQRDKIVASALACKGVGYSYADYLAIAAHRFHVPAPGLREYIASSRHMICSQLVDYCYQQAGVQLFTDNRWDGFVTPADLAGRIGA
jgi:hypothetical protein